MSLTDIDVSLGKTVKGFHKSTMLDWEGKIASSVFIGGCNFRCAFCHNPELVIDHEDMPSFSWAEISRHLDGHRGWIDGVVIGGGEPTLSHEIDDLAREIKHIGLPVKLDTNGSRPDVLKRLINSELVDNIAMDVKTGFIKYPYVTRSTIDPRLIRESVDIIAASGLDHEFRTTAYPPAADKRDLRDIAEHIGSRGGKKYVIQQFRPGVVLSEDASRQEPFRIDVLQTIADSCSDHVPTRVR